MCSNLFELFCEYSYKRQCNFFGGSFINYVADRHTYMVMKMPTNVHVGYLDGPPFVHVDMIFSIKFFKYVQNCSFQALKHSIYHFSDHLLSSMNKYILLAQRSKTRYILYVTKREGYRFSIVHVDNIYMIYLSTSVHQTQIHGQKRAKFCPRSLRTTPCLTSKKFFERTGNRFETIQRPWGSRGSILSCGRQGQVVAPYKPWKLA